MKKIELSDEWLENRFDEAKEPPNELLMALSGLQQEPVSHLSRIVEKYPNTNS